MAKVLIALVVLLLGQKLAVIAAIGFFLLILFFKKKVQRMDANSWEQYFRSFSVSSILRRMFLLYGIGEIVSGICSFGIFSALKYAHPVGLTFLVVGTDVLWTLLKYRKNREPLVEKIEKLSAQV